MRQIALAMMLCLSAAGAFAADNGIYMGGGLVRSSIDATDRAVAQALNNTELDDEDNGFKAIVGVRPLDWFAAEVNYIDFGEVTAGTANTRAAYGLKGIDAFALVLFGPPFLDVFAKGGFIRWDSDFSAFNNALSGDDSGFDVAYGAGVQLRLGSFATRLEYERFEIDDIEETSALTLALTWTFL
jgi:hypothetical protein